MKRMRRQEAGAALIIAIAVVAMLTVLGMIAVQMTTTDLEVTGVERGADSAMYIAEAGVQWALLELDLGYAIDPSNPNYTGITSQPTVSFSDPWGPTRIVGWHELHPAKTSMLFGGGGFRAVAKPAAAPDGDTLVIRSLGISASGAKRLIEVAVRPQ